MDLRAAGGYVACTLWPVTCGLHARRPAARTAAPRTPLAEASASKSSGSLLADRDRKLAREGAEASGGEIIRVLKQARSASPPPHLSRGQSPAHLA